MNEEVLSVPGDPERPASPFDSAMLAVTLLKPNGSGPFPLAVMNHGASGKTPSHKMPRYRYTFSAYYFLSRGYAVALPMMRGYSGSNGRQILEGCNQESAGLRNAKDISAVIDFMSTQPYIDSRRIVMAGQSYGGWNTLAFGTLNQPRVKGLINFVGGVRLSDCKSTSAALARAAEHFGAKTVTPSLWFYGDNDAIFAPPVWHAMFDRYTAAGGPAELVAYGRFMSDSHNLLGYPEGVRIWAPKADAFLSRVGLPSKITHPEYLPTEFPPPTNFAAVDNVDAVPYLNATAREGYRKFLSDPLPRVFVLAPEYAASFYGGFDPLGLAMNACRKRSRNCQVYVVDDYVTWVEPKAVPAQPIASAQSVSGNHGEQTDTDAR